METAQLEKFRELINTEREDVRKQLADLGADPDAESYDNTDFDFGFADSAQSTAERNRVLVVVEGLRERLVDINAALDKIDKGTFGRCENCGNEIGAERLEALPHTRLCTDCKSKG